MPYSKEQITPQWLAGFFDGEGCVAANTNDQSNFFIQVSLTQKNFELLSVIEKMFPNGKINIRSNNTSVIAWSGYCSIPVLEYIKGFVVVKKALVEYGLQMAKTYRKRYQWSTDSITRTKRNELGSTIKRLNEGRVM